MKRLIIYVIFASIVLLSSSLLIFLVLIPPITGTDVFQIGQSLTNGNLEVLVGVAQVRTTYPYYNIKLGGWGNATANPGWQFILVYIEIRNSYSKTPFLITENNFIFYDNKTNKAYSPGIYLGSEQIIGLYASPGNITRGWVVFTTPEGVDGIFAFKFPNSPNQSTAGLWRIKGGST